MKMTIVKDFNTIVECQTFEQIVERIKSTEFQYEIGNIRKAKGEGRLKTADIFKKSLLAFTPSGTFAEGRRLDNLVYYNPLVVLDFDNLSRRDQKLMIEMLPNIEYTYSFFLSPSGNGYKVFVRTDSNSSNHRETFEQIVEYYEGELGIEIDKSGSDIPRLCFFSHDPDLYLNNESTIFKFDSNYGNELEIFSELHEVNSVIEDKIEEAISFTENLLQYEKGERNNFIHLLAKNCNNRGLDMKLVLHFCYKKYDLPNREIKATVESTYRNHKEDFAKFADLANSVKLDNHGGESDAISSTPIISEKVYDTLPSIIKRGCDQFDNNRERDVFLLSCVTMISGCIPEVYGVYNRRKLYPNLYNMIVAPAGSGKGSMLLARDIAYPLHQQLSKDYFLAKKEFNKMKNKEENKDKLLTEPKRKTLIIPANTSGAMMVDHLNTNGGNGIIFEAEADTLANILKKEWGSYSDVLRKAFHHEPISMSRKTEGAMTEVDLPRLSVLLSGTPSQVTNLIPSGEDGLLSRFMFYLFRSSMTWRDLSPKLDSEDFSTYFKELGKEMVQINQYLANSPTEVQLLDQQWDTVNKTFSKYLNEAIAFMGENSSGVIFRLGVIFFRLTMVFSALRKFEDMSTESVVKCTAVDFKNALEIVDVLVFHSKMIFENMNTSSRSRLFNSASNKERFFHSLPDKFQRKEAVELGTTFDLSTRTVDAMLKKLEGHLLEKLHQGIYQKTDCKTDKNSKRA